ncbi:uncharacterized protein B0P05DRAFT_466348 [Gilbertella persicaria]|uniref:uncharacterized protein n=1 Tax=Gilbertella persicaria TaxID=101096 RepID=UPI00221F5814|nr:uncharacterized protein B0P05DRAFT_466348 [Gilbertella persicaria]KAI8085850.1 hypothetical protein B0P05DRAFT_466348 [Gilbertella persicaria]
MLEEDKQEGRGAEDDKQDAPKMCELRLIDFAHSDWHADRKTQDTELIKGFDNIIDILNECLKRQKTEKI